MSACDVGGVHYPPRICEIPPGHATGTTSTGTAITGASVELWMLALAILVVAGIWTLFRSARATTRAKGGRSLWQGRLSRNPSGR